MPCGSPVPLASPTSTWHQLMVLPFFCGSGSIVSTRPTTSGPGDVGAGRLERLELEAERGQPVREVAGGDVVRQVDVLADPGQRGAHGQISVPKAAVKRTSPSTMSRMSSTPWRNISVRSMPMPNAKPV